MTTSSAAPPPGKSSAVPQWTFADRVRKIRRDVLRMEQGEFAGLLGVTRQAYAAWESGRNEPRSILAVARRIEEVSGVPAAWVLGIEGGGPGHPSADQATRNNTEARSRETRAMVVAFPQAVASAATSPRPRGGRPTGRAA